MKYTLAIDQGTTSSRCVIYNERFQAIGLGQKPFPQHFPQASWVEHDVEEIWDSVKVAIQGALKAATDADANFSVQKIAAIGITNQRETFALWDRKTGKAIAPAIVWQCRRSAGICTQLKKSSAAKTLTKITGLVVDPYFSGTKVKWLLDSNPIFRKRASAGELCFGTIDTFLISRLTGREAHVTDASNASRTMLMDLKTGAWSPTCLKILKIPAQILPTILSSDGTFGKTKDLGLLPDGIVISGVLGDQQAALFGQSCLDVGEAKVTYGTGAFMLINTGKKIPKTKNGLSTVAWKIKNQTSYAIEGSVFIAGAAVSFVRDGLGIISRSDEIEALARKVPDNDGVFFIPALSGLGGPYWHPEAKGLIGGLTRRSTKAHVARATLEGIAHSVADVFETLCKDAKLKLKSIRVDGGASMNGLLLELQANTLQTRIERPSDIESTSRGAGLMAALGAGLISSTRELKQKSDVAVEVRPQIKPAACKKLRDLWKKRVKALLAGAY